MCRLDRGAVQVRRVVQVGWLVAGYLLFVMLMGSLHPLAIDATAHARHLEQLQHVAGVDYVESFIRALSFGAAGSPLYVGLHFLVTPLVMLWLIWARPGVWRRSRWWLLGIAAVALAVFAVVPVAPPWMVGWSDGTPWAHPASAAAGIDTLAAFPSLHVALAVWVVMSLRAAGVRARGLWVYPLFVAVLVVATGNHYLLDVLGGWLLAWGCCGGLMRREKPATDKVTGCPCTRSVVDARSLDVLAVEGEYRPLQLTRPDDDAGKAAACGLPPVDAHDVHRAAVDDDDVSTLDAARWLCGHAVLLSTNLTRTARGHQRCRATAGVKPLCPGLTRTRSAAVAMLERPRAVLRKFRSAGVVGSASVCSATRPAGGSALTERG